MTTRKTLLTALLAGLLAATPALAHRQWMQPSATVLSGDKAWVTASPFTLPPNTNRDSSSRLARGL